MYSWGIGLQLLGGQPEYAGTGNRGEPGDVSDRSGGG
jgi:hypothetical protein